MPPTQVNVYPARKEDRVFIDSPTRGGYDTLYRLLWGMRFNRRETSLQYEGGFNYRALQTLYRRSNEEYPDRYNLLLHPLLQKRYDSWDARRQKLLKIKANKDLNLADDYFRSNDLWPFQRVDAKFAFEAKKCLLAHEMGAGKAQPLGADVATATGYVKMGNILVDDWILGPDGREHRVIGVFPQGPKMTYMVRFNDGTTVDASGEHLWNVNTSTRLHRGDPYRLLTTEQIKKEGFTYANGGARHFVPPTAELSELHPQFVPIPAYTMGCILGNGSICNGTVRVTIPDPQMYDRIKSELPSFMEMKHQTNDDYVLGVSVKSSRNPYITALTQMGLMGKYSYEKHIPQEYIWNSTGNRKALLQGLFDSDGCAVATHHGVEYSSSSEQLIKDLVLLLQTFGAYAKIHYKPDNYYRDEVLGDKVTCRPSWRITPGLPQDFNPFYIDRKRNAVMRRTRKMSARYIVDIQEIGEQECQCILLDSKDHLYLTEGMIPTHNTIIAAAAYEMARKFDGVRKLLVICPSQIRTNWKQELLKWTTLPSFIDETGRRDSHHVLVANAAASGDRMMPVLQAVLTEAEHVLIINWDMLRLPWFNRFFIENASSFDMIIADEAHRARNLKTGKAAQVFVQLHAKYQFALSGTVVVNYPEDMFSIVHWLYPDQYTDYDTFSEDFVQRPQKAMRNVSNARSTEIILDKLDLELDYLMVRREKEDVMPWLPKKRVDPVYVSLYPKQRKQYEMMRDELITILSGDKVVDAPIKLTQIMRLKQLAISPASILLKKINPDTGKPYDVSDPIIQKSDEGPKLDYVIDWIKEAIDAKEKVVVFSQFETVIKLLEYRLNKIPQYGSKQLRYVYCASAQKHISGHVVKDDRAAGMDAVKVLETAFQEDEDVNVWLGTLKTGGEGITLTAACNLISIDQWWNAASMSQGDDRLHRGGQLRPVRIHRLIAHDTVELEILDLIATKQLSFDQMVRTGKLLEILMNDKARQEKLAA